MIEAFCLFFGLGFSALVYFRSIRTADLPPAKKAFYSLFTFIGITGTLFLFGILAANALRKMHVL